jgi:hypothetical protein
MVPLIGQSLVAVAAVFAMHAIRERRTGAMPAKAT